MLTTINPTTREKHLHYFGKWIVTPLFSIGSGIISTVATSGLSIVASISQPWLSLFLTSVFLAETTVWIYLFKESVPETLITIFAKNMFSGLSNLKKALIAFGLFCSLGGGFALGGLTYMSGIKAITAMLNLISVSLPLITSITASILGVFGFIAISSLFAKWISSSIINNSHLQIKQFFNDLFTRDENKLLSQQLFEGFFKLLFISVMIGLTIIGTIATLGTVQKGLNAFLNLAPRANQATTRIASSIIAYGMMGIARLPLAIQSVSVVAANLGEKIGYALFRIGSTVTQTLGISHPLPAPALALTLPLQQETLLSTTAKIGALGIHGFSFGALAESGGSAVLSDVMTALDFPLTPESIKTVGHVAAMASGGAMSVGIAAFSFFYKLPKTQERPQQNQHDEPESAPLPLPKAS
jgi:hypothetical protein